MSYIVNDTRVSLPLSVESIEKWIAENSKLLNSDLDKTMHTLILQGMMLELYRDVLVVIRSRASHSAELAEAALKLEDL